MARNKVYTDHVFGTEREALKYITDHYSAEKNYIMRNAKKAGKKVSVGVERSSRGDGGRNAQYVIVIYVG